MSVRVTDNTSKIILNTKRKGSLAVRYMLDDIHDIATPNTPQQYGNLRRNVLKQVLGLKGTIAWVQNYAVFQETKQFKNYTTSGTGPHFAENSVNRVTKSPLNAMRKAGLI